MPTTIIGIHKKFTNPEMFYYRMIEQGDFTKHFSVNEINIINYFLKRTDLTFEQKLQIIKENIPKLNNCNPILTII